MNSSAQRSRWAVALLVVIGLSACVNFIPREDYPTEYPAAPLTGACPDLNGTFENIGTRLDKASGVSHPIELSNFLLSSGVVPSTAQISALEIRGPTQGLLQIEALSPEGAIARSSIPATAKADGFIHIKPFSAFLCDMYQGRGNVVVTSQPVTMKNSAYDVAVRIYRAKDGSLVVAQEEIHTDFLGEVDVWRQWFRFQQVSAKP